MSKQEIKAIQVGRNLIVVIDKKKYTKACTPEEIKSIQNKILLFNRRNTETTKTTIINFFDKKKKESEILKATEKGLKKSVKKVEKEAKKDTKKAAKVKKTATKVVLEKVKKTASRLGYKVVKKSSSTSVSDMLVHAKDGGMALKGFEQVSMPDLLIKKINEWLDAEKHIQPLINFWSLCLLNPNPIARTKLFDYLNRQKLIVTPSGYFVTYRMVKKTDEIGIYTDAHTGKMKYRIGKACKIPREECDEDGGKDCSRGLHTGTPKFIGIVSTTELSEEEGKGTLGDGYGVTTKSKTYDSFGTGYDRPSNQKFNNSFGNQAIITLINPAHVVSIPNSDTRKMRSCEFFFAKLTTPEEVIEMNDGKYLEFDKDYQKIEFEQIEDLLKTKQVKALFETTSKEGSKKHDQLTLELIEVQNTIKLSSDKINQELEPEQLKAIIKQRQILLNNAKSY